MTAAHCVRKLSTGKDTDARKMQIISTNDISNSGDKDQTRSGSVVYIHSTYSNGFGFRDRVDMAIIKVDSPFSFSGTIAGIIELSNDIADENPGNAIVSGFGTTVSNTQGNSQIASVLQWVQIPIVTYSVCNARASANGLGGAPYKSVCGGSKGKDSCSGDSGGPLFITKNNNRVQIGVVSTGTATSNPLCGEDNEYGIYTSVAQNRQWIDSVLSLVGNQTAANVSISTSSPTPPVNTIEGSWTITSGSCDPNSCSCCFTGTVKISSTLGIYSIRFESVKGTQCSSNPIDSLIGITRIVVKQQNQPFASFQYNGLVYVVAVDGTSMTIVQGTAACIDPKNCPQDSCSIYVLSCTGGACSPALKRTYSFVLFVALFSFIFTFFYRR